MPTARVAPAPDADGDYDPLQEVTTVNSTAPLPGALELGAYSPAEQWRCVGENGSLLRITHFVVSAIDVIILVEGTYRIFLHAIYSESGLRPAQAQPSQLVLAPLNLKGHAGTCHELCYTSFNIVFYVSWIFLRCSVYLGLASCRSILADGQSHPCISCGDLCHRGWGTGLRTCNETPIHRATASDSSTLLSPVPPFPTSFAGVRTPACPASEWSECSWVSLYGGNEAG